MKLSETQYSAMIQRLARDVIAATSSGFEVNHEPLHGTHWAISQKQRESLKMVAQLLTEHWEESK